MLKQTTTIRRAPLRSVSPFAKNYQQRSCRTGRKPSVARSTGFAHQVFAKRAAVRNFNFFCTQLAQMVWRRTTCEYNSVRAMCL
jgi:hypothetical protein